MSDETRDHQVVAGEQFGSEHHHKQQAHREAHAHQQPRRSEAEFRACPDAAGEHGTESDENACRDGEHQRCDRLGFGLERSRTRYLA